MLVLVLVAAFHLLVSLTSYPPAFEHAGVCPHHVQQASVPNISPSRQLLGVLVLVLVAVSHILLACYRRRDPAGHSTSRRLRSPALPLPDDEATVDTIA